MILFPPNPTSVSVVCEGGQPVAFTIQHPLLDAPIKVPFDHPDQLTSDDLETYRLGHVNAIAATYGPGATIRVVGDTGRPTLDLAANITDALRTAGVSADDASALPEIWEDRSARRRPSRIVGSIEMQTS